MSGFTIPGLGFAKPNETLPPLPADVLAAAASFEGVKVDQDDTTMADASAAPADAATTPSEPQKPSTAAEPTTATPADAMNVDTEPNLFGALEASLGFDEPSEIANNGDASAATAQTTVPPNTSLQQAPQGGQGEAEGEHPEWEVDSSPYESSSDSSSSDSSDDDDDQGGYELMGVEETARMLMEADSDEEGEGGKSGGNNQLRTKNEMAWEPIPKPDVQITPEMKVEELGAVDQIVENIMVVKAFTPGEYQVLDTGSVLCTAERVVIGAIAETIGKVLQPMYTVMFSTPEDIKELGLVVGTKVCYPVEHAKFVFTQPLRNVKGSDASNIHDEEVAEEEMEFSDDEKEAEHKKAQKQKRREKSGRGGRGGGKEPHPLRNEVKPDPASGGLNYDDEDDGPYKPLQRPASFGQGPPIQQSFIEEPEPGTAHRFGGFRGRGDFRGRGRGRDRGRGRGGRGRGGGGHQHHRESGEGYAQPSNSQRSPEAQRSSPQLQNQWAGGNNFQPQPSSSTASAPQAPAAPAFNFPFTAPMQQSGQGGFVPPPPPGWPVQQGGQNVAPGGQPAQPAAHFNPAFFAALLGQMQRNQAQGGGQGSSQWPGQPPQPPQ